MEEALPKIDVAAALQHTQEQDALRVDTVAASSTSASDLPLNSPAEATEMSHLRELRTAGGFGASTDEMTMAASTADNSSEEAGPS